MPVCKWKIEPTDLVCNDPLSRTNHQPKDFTDISNEICSNIVRQLSSLSQHAQDLFRELNSQAQDISVRSARLSSKVIVLKERSNQLNPTFDKVSLDDIILCKPFKSGFQRQLHGMGRPEAVVEAYSKLEAIPDLHLLNKFKDENETDCSKLYSDPNFFFLSWCGQIKQEVDKKPTRKKAPAKKKAEVTRKPQNLNLRRIQDRVKNEIIGGVSRTSKKPEATAECAKEHQDRKEHLNERLSLMSASSKTSLSSNHEKSETTSGSNREALLPPPPLPPPSLPPPSLPPPSLPITTTTTTAEVICDQSEDNLDGDFNLPPPPIVDFQRRGTLYLVEDFIPDFQVLPAPPSLDMFQALSSSLNEEIPQIPPLPPELPVNLDEGQQAISTSFSDSIAGNAFKIKSSPSTPAKCSSVDRQSSSGKDSRNDLLSAIRHGIKLRKVDEVRQEVRDQNQDGMAGMFDVQMILEMRRRALQDDDEEEDDYDSECSWDD